MTDASTLRPQIDPLPAIRGHAGIAGGANLTAMLAGEPNSAYIRLIM
jgi:hypothetical protein